MSSINQPTNIDQLVIVTTDIHTQLAEEGRKFQPEFIDVLGDSLLSLVWEWMKKNGVPANVRRALELGEVLNMAAESLKNGDLIDPLAEDLLYNVPEATRLVWELGGTFYGADGSELLR